MADYGDDTVAFETLDIQPGEQDKKDVPEEVTLVKKKQTNKNLHLRNSQKYFVTLKIQRIQCENLIQT